MASSEPKFIIEPNKKYLPNTDGVIVLQNCPSAVSNSIASAQGTSTNSINFRFGTNKNFLDRGVILHMPKIPLKFRLKTPLSNASVITKDNMMTNFFNGNSGICLQQFGILNAIQTIQVELDNSVFVFSDIDKKLLALSRYYSTEDLHKYFNASLIDTMNQLNLYDATKVVDSNPANYLKVLSVDGTEVIMKRPNLSNNNVFDSTMSLEHSSRQPLFEFVQWNDDGNFDDITVNLIDQSCFLPCTLFGIPGDDNILHNIDTVNINITLRSDWASRLFCFKKLVGAGTANDGFMKSVEVNNIKTTFSPKLLYRLYTPPPYIPVNIEKSYTLSIPNIVLDNKSKKLEMTPLQKMMAVEIDQVTLTAMPKKILIYATQQRQNAAQHVSDGTFFARIDSITTSSNLARTMVSNNPLELYEVCKKNGLNLPKESMYTVGYPVLLNVTDDISCEANSMVGVSGSFPFSFNLTVSNLRTVDTTYDVHVIYIYDSMFIWDPYTKRHEMKTPLISKSIVDESLHADRINNHLVQNMNLIGGSLWTTLGSYAKKFGSGVVNVIKAIAENKNGFREKLVDAYNGAGIMYPNNNVVGGLDNHLPLTGGKSVSNWGTK